MPAEPVYAVAITPRTQADDDKLASSLHRLQEEDPALVVRRDDETHQTVLSGAGDTHLAVALERLERKFGVHVDLEDVKVPYRETVTGSADAIVHMRARDIASLEDALERVRIAPNVDHTRSAIVLSRLVNRNRD